jgi:hypothetical protein
MNLKPPLRFSSIEDLQPWLEDLYNHLKSIAVHTLKFVGRSAAPDSEAGKMYYDTDDNALLVYDGTAWRYLLGNDDIGGTANEINVTDNGDGTLTIGIVDPLIVAKGGTGLATLTDGAFQIGAGTGTIEQLGPGANGTLPIGSTGATPTIATITGTAGQITITNGAGSITISITDPLAIGGLTTTGARIVKTTRIDDGDSPYTVLSTDHNIFCDTDGGVITANLPAGVNGTYYRIINVGTSSNNLTLAPNGAELLLGVNSNSVLTDGESLIVVYETTEGWY